MKSEKTNGRGAPFSGWLAGILVLAGLLVLVNPPLIAYAGEQKQALVDGNASFAFDLYGQLAKREPVSTALAMTFAGARGNTEKQMAKALRFSLSQQQIHLAYV